MKSSKQRKYLHSRYGLLYKRAHNCDLDKCIYCGSPRECLDHVPALTLLEGIDVALYLKTGGKLILYPCCSDCNIALGSLEIIDLYDRMAHLIQYFDKKLSKCEMWSKEELEEMGPSMRTYIESKMSKAGEIIEKMSTIDKNMLKIKENGNCFDECRE